MKTSLTDLIKNNPQAFSHDIPPFGHFERFEQKLEASEQRHLLQSRRWIMATSIAAMLAVILIFQFTHSLHTSPATNESVTEVAGYYTLQLNEEIDKLKQELKTVDVQSRQEIMNDIRRMLKDNLPDEISRMQAPQEEKITLIVMRYNACMQTLQHIQSLLETIPNKNNKL